MTIELKPVIQVCNDASAECATVCAETLQYSLQKGGRFAEESHIQALLDCIELCKTDAEIMVRGSEITADACRLTAEACQRCAEHCEQFTDDPQMKACAEVCRRCASACLVVAA